MKVLLLLLVLSLSHLGESRTASSEVAIKAKVVGDIDIVEKRAPLHLACVFRTVKIGEPYPSVIVKWQNQAQRFTWNEEGDVKFDKNFKLDIVSHGYPSSGGLSGSTGTKTPSDPFASAPVVPDTYTWEDIVSWFQKDCSKP